MCQRLLGLLAYLQARRIRANALHDLLEGRQQEAALARLRGSPQAGRQHVLRVDWHAAVLAHRLPKLVSRQLWPAHQPWASDTLQTHAVRFKKHTVPFTGFCNPYVARQDVAYSCTQYPKPCRCNPFLVFK